MFSRCTLFRGVRSIFQKISLISSHSCCIVQILLRAGVYLVFCGCSDCGVSTDAELVTIPCLLGANSFTEFVKGPSRSFYNPTRFCVSCFLDSDSFTGFVKGPRRSFYNPTRICARIFCKNCISAAAVLFPVQ